MSIMRVTITAYGDLAEQDYRGLQGLMSIGVAAGTSRTYNLTLEQWNAFRPVLTRASQKRVPIISGGLPTGRTQPLLTYTVTRIPGGRPVVHQIEGALSLAGGTQTFVLRGANLIQGFQASAVVKKGLDSQLTFTATRKGPVGNRVSVTLQTASGAGSVTTTPDDLGGASIVVVPAAASPGANDIADQIAADAEASRYVVATGGGTGTVGPVGPTVLTGGDGEGIAFLDVRTAVDGSYLRLESRVPGNSGNLITVVVNAASGAGSVSVSGNDITVTPAAAGPSIGAVATQMNANAACAALVKATAIGTGGTALPATAKHYFYAGAGDDVSVTIGGAPAKVTTYTDSAITFTVAGGAGTDVLGPAGLAEDEQALVVILSDYGVIQAGQVVVGA